MGSDCGSLEKDPPWSAVVYVTTPLIYTTPTVARLSLRGYVEHPRT